MKFYLIRHAKSISNDLNEWTGQRDVPLSQTGIDDQKEIALKYSYPKGEIYFSSPQLRCTQSLETIYGHGADILLPDLLECSMGILEGKKYDNLDSDPLYLSWINEPNKPIPNGESFNAFRTRSELAFEKMLALTVEKKIGSAVAMMHGNVMRAILHRFADSSIEHNKWMIPNGGIYMLNVEEKTLRVNSWKTMPSFLFKTVEETKI